MTTEKCDLSDTELLDWMESCHTLHRAIEVLYVVDGYIATYTHDHAPSCAARGETYREAILNLRVELSR